MTPQQIDLVIYQGSSFKKSWEITDKDTGDPIDLTGYTARMQIRAKLKDVDFVAELTTENGGITITVTGTETTMALYISATGTATIASSSGIYDLELVDTSDDVYRFMQGDVEISKEVTR